MREWLAGNGLSVSILIVDGVDLRMDYHSDLVAERHSWKDYCLQQF